ncbi:hypothetical protein RRG08_004908 [Elysia crispata]|uniref:Retinol dehydrogenase 13 n=1 Tax=Elysia crispata TaxID=231223 RepID=A0AAE0ZIR5_9GAST|nr:hypothetical protein RRG08_004908 [Elysia crispata]
MPTKYAGKETVAGKTVVVTGANTGIGKETCRDLAMRGGRIIMACRNTEKGEQARKEIVEETRNEHVVVKELDLGSLESVQNFAMNFNESESRLDILINNAGVAACPKTLTKDGLEMQIGTNHFGHFLLTNLLLDKLKACSPSRIVIVSSSAHSMGKMNFNDLNSEKSYGEVAAYGQSKLANLLHALELSKRLQGTGVTVNSLHPGAVNTELTRHAKQKGWANMLLTAAKPLFVTPEQGAQTTLRLALDKSLEQESGKYFAELKEKTPSNRAQNEADAKRLWDMTEEIMQEKLGSTNM